MLGVKTILMGPCRSGKTSLLRKLKNLQVSEDHSPTEGLQLIKHEIEPKEKLSEFQSVLLNIWDSVDESKLVRKGRVQKLGRNELD